MYLNTLAGNYGMNNDAPATSRAPSGPPTPGCVNFKPTHGGVTIDPAIGDFPRHATSKNAGWIEFAGMAQKSTVYKVKTEPIT